MYNSLQLLLENDTPWTLKPAGKDWPPRTRDCSAHVFAGAPSPWSTSPCPHWSGAPPCTARHWSVSGSCGMSGHLHPKLPCKNSRASDLTLSCVPQTSHFPVSLRPHTFLCPSDLTLSCVPQTSHFPVSLRPHTFLCPSDLTLSCSSKGFTLCSLSSCAGFREAWRPMMTQTCVEIITA